MLLMVKHFCVHSVLHVQWCLHFRMTVFTYIHIHTKQVTVSSSASMYVSVMRAGH